MPAAYSHDLREKVVAVIDRRARKSHVSQMFHISRDTLGCWLQRRETTGSVKAAQGYQQAHSHPVKDWQAVRAFAQTYGDRTPAEMALLWQGQISQRTIARALAPIDWTRAHARQMVRLLTAPCHSCAISP